MVCWGKAGKLRPWKVAADTFFKNQNTKILKKKLWRNFCCHWSSDTLKLSSVAQCLESGEHVLRCYWEVLASSCSYRFLLALLLLLLSPDPRLPLSAALLTNHNWQGTNRTLSAPMERVVSPVLVKGGSEEQVEWRLKGKLASDWSSLGKSQPNFCKLEHRLEFSLVVLAANGSSTPFCYEMW